MMDQDRERQYGSNPFAPAMSNSGGAMDAGIPQIPAAQAAAMADQGESAKEKAIGLAMDKGMNAGVDKGAGILTKALSGLGASGSAASTAAMAGRAGLTGAGPGLASAATGAAGKGGAAAAGGAGMAGMAAAAAPILPFVIGAMALKSIFKK